MLKKKEKKRKEPKRKIAGRFRQAFKRYLLAGLLVTIPVALTAFILLKLLKVADGILRVVPGAWQPKTYLGFDIPGLGLLIVLFGILVIGVITTTVLGHRLVTFGEKLLRRIPVVRGLYSSIKQLASTLFSGNDNRFSHAVLVEWPRRGTHAVAFMTGEAAELFSELTGETLVSIFLPTTPNPTTGFFFMVPAKDIKLLDLPADDAFKVLMSAGLIIPTADGELGEAKPVDYEKLAQWKKSEKT